MKAKLRLVLAAASVVAVVLITVLATTGSAATRVRVKVIEHATTDTTVDTGLPGDTSGDLLTFHNKVFNAADSKVAGHDQGTCIRIVPGRSWECTWTTFLSGGHISVEGPFYDARDSTLSVTGGTGAYRDASGEMELHSLAGGTKYAFVFKLVLG